MSRMIDPDPIEPTVGLVVDRTQVLPAQSTERTVVGSAGVERRETVVTDDAGVAHRERLTRDVAAEQLIRFTKATQVTWLVVGIIETLIGLRVLLKLIGANPANDFANFIYGFAGLFVGPFNGLTGSPAAGAVVLEIPSLIAMLIYALVGWGLIQIFRLVLIRTDTRTTATYDRYASR